MILSFNRVEFDAAACLIRMDGSVVHVEPQVYDVLAHLILHRDRVVTKEELLDEVWGSRFVSESALTSRIKSARAAVGDSGRAAQHTIRTVRGKGYQFVARVEVRGAPDPEVGVERQVPPFATIRPPDNTFHGRDVALSELVALVETRQLVTVVGPGGTGKTRLAAELVDRRAGDAVFVDLAAVREGDAVGQALVAALGIEVGSLDDEVSAATAFLRTTDLLLLVDNCEHVVASAAAVVRRVRTEAPRTRVLATSRLPLGLRDEHVVRLGPLPLPAASERAAIDGNPAVALFVDRARQAASDLELDDATMMQVVALCRALDGLPLALELAAGRASTFALGDLLARLDRRLDLLGDERSDSHERHRSLRATLDWSHEQLDPTCQTLFLHLAAFPAGLTLEGVEWLMDRLAIDADVWSVIERLVSASLLVRAEHPSGSRYVQLETMRTFGLDRLDAAGSLPNARDLQAHWVSGLLDDLHRTGTSEREHHWADRIRRELPNIRYARQHLRLSGRLGELLQISVALDRWAQFRDVSEIWVWADELLAIDTWTPAESARVHALAGLAAWRRGRVLEAERLGTAALETVEPSDAWASERALNALATAKLFRGEFQVAADIWLACAEVGGDTLGTATAAIPLAYAGQLDRARALAGEGYQRAVDQGWPSAIAWSAYAVGEVEAAAGAPSARVWMENALATADAVGSSFTHGVASVTWCSLLAANGDIAGAAAGYRDLITHWLRSGSWTQLWTTIRNTTSLLCDIEPALCLLALDMADEDPHASRLESVSLRDQDELRADLRAQLGPQQVAELQAERTAIDRIELAMRVRGALDRSAEAHSQRRPE